MNSISGGSQIEISEIWQCTPRLRWRKNYDDRQNGCERGGMVRYGEFAPTLQQLWYCQTSGKTEWRDVPTAEPGDESV